VSAGYRVELPRADGMRLAGIGMGWPETPEGRCVQAVCEWLTGLERRRTRCVTVAKISRDLWPLLEQVCLAERPQRGPFAPPPGGGAPLPGQVRYLGAGTVRLDETALRSLATLAAGQDFRIAITPDGPVLTIGAQAYPARPEP
jgi:hypothetical protein